MEYDPKLTMVAIYVKELLQEKGCDSEESCVVLLDVISDLIVEYAKGDVKKLAECSGEWSTRIIKEITKKSFKRFPPPMRSLPIPPPRTE